MCTYAYTVVYESSKRNLVNNLKQPNTYADLHYCFITKEKLSCCYILLCYKLFANIYQEIDSCLNFISGLVDWMRKKVNDRCVMFFLKIKKNQKNRLIKYEIILLKNKS